MDSLDSQGDTLLPAYKNHIFGFLERSWNIPRVTYLRASTLSRALSTRSNFLMKAIPNLVSLTLPWCATILASGLNFSTASLAINA